MATQDKPIIVQSDGSILLEVQSPEFECARDAVLPFAELIKSPEYVHTYRVTPLSIWNAAALGISCEEVFQALRRYSRYEIPEGVLYRIRDAFGRWDAVRLTKHDGQGLLVETRTAEILEEILGKPGIRETVREQVSPRACLIDAQVRGRFKHLLVKAGFPVHDLVGYDPVAHQAIRVRGNILSGREFAFRR